MNQVTVLQLFNLNKSLRDSGLVNLLRMGPSCSWHPNNQFWIKKLTKKFSIESQNTPKDANLTHSFFTKNSRFATFRKGRWQIHNPGPSKMRASSSVLLLELEFTDLDQVCIKKYIVAWIVISKLQELHFCSCDLFSKPL